MGQVQRLALGGRVIGPDGRGISNAIVILWEHEGSTSPASMEEDCFPAAEDFLRPPPGSVTTDASGSFRIEIESGQTEGQLAAHAAGFAPATAAIPVRASEVRLQLRPGLSLGGVVRTGANGAPAHGISVWCAPRPESAGLRLVTHTDRAGRFTIADRPPGPYTLAFGLRSIHAGGECVPQSVRGVRAGATNLEFAVALGLALGGQVLDETDTPVRGLALAVCSVDRPSASTRRETVTDSDGAFRIGGLIEGAYLVSLPLTGFATPPEAEGGDPAPATVGPIRAGQGTLRIRVVRGVRIQGTFQGREPESSRPRPPVTVSVSPDDEDPAFPATFRCAVVHDGTFVTRPLDPSRTYTLDARRLGRSVGAAIRGVRPGEGAPVLRED